jgi:hypothetical protein
MKKLDVEKAWGKSLTHENREIATKKRKNVITYK